MSTGVKIINSTNGSVSIDENYTNMWYDKTISLPVSQLRDLGVNGSEHLKCIYSENGTGITRARDSSNYALEMYSTAFNPCSVLIFKRTEPAKPNMGMVIRNPNTGNIVFSSEELPLKVIESYSGIVSQNPPTSEVVLLDKQYNSARKYGVVIGSLPSMVMVYGMVDGNYSTAWGLNIKSYNGRVTVSFKPIGMLGAPARLRGVTYNSVFNFLVADITDIV